MQTAHVGTEVGHVTRDSDTTFKVKRSKRSTCRGRGHIVASSGTACYCNFSGSSVQLPMNQPHMLYHFHIHCVNCVMSWCHV